MTTEELANELTFDGASNATREMFEQPQAQEDIQNEEIQEPMQEPMQEPIQEQPIQQPIQQPDMAQVISAMQQEIENLTALLKQQNQVQQNNVVQDVLEPEPLVMPTLDFNALAYADEETARQMQEQYAQQMAAYTEQQAMKRFEPYLKQAEEAQINQEKQGIIESLSQDPMFKDINSYLPQINHIMQNSKAISGADAPMAEKVINAFLIAKAMNLSEPTAEQLLERTKNMPEFADLYEKQRIASIKDSQQVPTFSASSGAVNAALNIKEKPKTLAEASRLTREMFGL